MNFAPTETARGNLLRESKDDKNIYVVGNTVIDALLATVKKDYHFEDAEIEAIEPEDLPSFQKLVPVYGLTEGIKTPQLRRMIEGALALVEDADENLPEDTVRREN